MTLLAPNVNQHRDPEVRALLAQMLLLRGRMQRKIIELDDIGINVDIGWINVEEALADLCDLGLGKYFVDETEEAP